jgi:hypothetical protein
LFTSGWEAQPVHRVGGRQLLPEPGAQALRPASSRARRSRDGGELELSVVLVGPTSRRSLAFGVSTAVDQRDPAASVCLRRRAWPS